MTADLAPTSRTAPEQQTFVPGLAGELYTDFLSRVHATLAPKAYLEIGTYSGDSLAFAQGRAIAVDPNFAPLTNVFAGKTACHLFQMTSDDFFRQCDPEQILGAEIDLAFLDGMHLFEYLLRDFSNTEGFCRQNSIIILHDCLPVDVHITTRVNDPELRRQSTRPDWWTGDVWKVLPILRKYRPDLAILALDAPPTGLVMVTNLDPHSTILKDRHFNICSEYSGVELLDYGIERFFSENDIRSTREFVRLEDFSRNFWL